LAVVNVLGLDGSLQNFGIAVARVDTGTWTVLDVKNLVLSKTTKNTDKKVRRADDDFKRFAQHVYEVRLIAAVEKVEYIFGEIPSGAQDARAAFAFGGVTAMLAALTYDYKVVTVTPAEVKLAATGMKHADKDDVIRAMYSCFPDAPWLTSNKPNQMDIKTPEGKYLTNANEHLADAVGVILAGIKKCKD
jgi:Holliday junction resolvasome RuvABC endonuclease subunit